MIDKRTLNMDSAPDQSTPTGDSKGQSAEPALRKFLEFWGCAWLGIIFAGAIMGFVPGAVTAAIIGIPFIYTCAVLSWALWLIRYSVIFAALAGGLTGIASALLVAGPILVDPSGPMLAVPAAFFGAVGGGVATRYYANKSGWPPTSTSANDRNAWQFSLRDLFLRFTAVSILIAVWAALLARLLR